MAGKNLKKDFMSDTVLQIQFNNSKRLRSEIRSYLKPNMKLSARELVREAQAIESYIAQQKNGEKLKHAVLSEEKSSSKITTDSISFKNSGLQPTLTSSLLSSLTSFQTTDDHNRGWWKRSKRKTPKRKT